MIKIPDEIKRLYLEHGVKKNIRISFPNGDHEDICNDKIVLNSVKFTESICSQNTLRLGMAEASVFRCEVVDIDNIKGKQILVYNEIFCSSMVVGSVYKSDLNSYVYQIPYGYFHISSATKQADMRHRQIEAYGLMAYQDWKIISNYEKAKSGVNGLIIPTNTPYRYNIIKLVLSNMKGAPSLGYTYTLLTKQFDRDYRTNPIFMSTGATYSDGTYYVIEVIPYYYSQINVNDQNQNAAHQTDLIYIKRNPMPDFTNTDTIPGLLRSYNSQYNFSISQEDMYKIKEMLEGGFFYVSGFHALAEASPLNSNIDYIYPNISFYGSSSDPYVYTPQIAVTEFAEIRITRHNPTESSRVIKTNQMYCRGVEDFYRVDGIPEITGTVQRTAFSDYNGIHYAITDSSYLTKEVIDSTIEICGGIGNFKRDGTFELVNIQTMSGLYPNNELYPNETLYPYGTKGYTTPASYQSAWYDDALSKPYGRVIATYKNLNNDEVFAQHIISSDYASDNYQDYDISSNEIIRSYQFNPTVIASILTTIANSIQGVQYMPSEVTAVGQPWLEAGDTIGIETISGEVLKTIILSRELSGEQILTDFYDSY